MTFCASRPGGRKVPIAPGPIGDDACLGPALGIVAGMADGRPWPRRCCVVDLETRPDRFAQVLARRSRGAPPGSPINEIVNASALTFVEREDGSLADWQLASWHGETYREADVIANLELALAGAVADGGRVVSFNGRQFDLPVLRMRQMRWWMAEIDSVERLLAGEAAHVDVMLDLSGGGEGRWPSLADACASVGFSLLGPNGVGCTTELPHATVKCELDVVGTAIMYHYVLAARRRSSVPLRRGLPAFGDFLRRAAETRPHLERIALTEQLREDAGAWGGDPHRLVDDRPGPGG